MKLRATCMGLMTLICLASGQAEGVLAQEQVESAPPYLMIRSLQTIQDKVINGDLSSVEMQRFLLDEIDKRLRTIDMAVFDDPRNVDAALIYAMSGGNPATLDILAERDIEGNFDNRLTSILRRYLAGRGATALKQLKEVVPEYRNTRIGPYIELIGANALMEKETDLALKFFDWAREEARPAVQTRLMDVAADGQTMAAASMHSAFNVANAIGAWLGGVVIAMGFGFAATGWVGVVLSIIGLGIFGLSVWLERKSPTRSMRTRPAQAAE